jgi:hypothetical protein
MWRKAIITESLSVKRLMDEGFDVLALSQRHNESDRAGFGASFRQYLRIRRLPALGVLNDMR